MLNMLYAGLGGFLGSGLRYGVGVLFKKWVKTPYIPFHTLTANILGCLLIGIIGKWVSDRDNLNPAVISFLMVGVLGGFTTFSAFSYETLLLLRENRIVPALLNIGLSLVLGLLAVWLGYTIVK